MKMSSKISSLLCLAVLLAFSSCIHAFDITNLLGQYPEFSTFGKYLTETKLVEQINSRNTITILAVGNGALGALSGKSQDEIKATMSRHVVLDYFDEQKLMTAQGSGEQLVTLYQASGLAKDQQGFIKVALIGEGAIAFGSAVKGSPMDVELVRTVTKQPYNISILEVSKPIIVPGGAGSQPSAAQAPTTSTTTAKAPAPTTTTTTTTTAKAPAPTTTTAKAPAPTTSSTTTSTTTTAKAPVPSTKAPVSSSSGAKAPESNSSAAKAPVASSSTAKAPVSSAKAPVASPQENASAPTPSDAVSPPAPSVAEAPEGAAPEGATSPAAAPAQGPAPQATADAKAPASSSSRAQIGLVGVVMAFASLLVVV